MYKFFSQSRQLPPQKRTVRFLHPARLARYKALKALSTCFMLMLSPGMFAQSTAGERQSPLALQEAINIALKNDDWLIKSELMQSRLVALSEGASALPDPVFSAGLLNLPTDGFAINQEPMTQFKVGATQMFARGDSLALQERKLKLSANEQPYLRDNRRLRVMQQTTHLWLSAFEASASYKLVNDARPLFEKLGDIVSASYASSTGNANQQDIISAELELIRLKDRLIALNTSKRVALSQLSRFLFLNNSTPSHVNTPSHRLTLPTELGDIERNITQALAAISHANGHTNGHTNGNTNKQSLYKLIETHPLIGATEQRVQVSGIDIEIAEQAYKPQYAVNASYALRNDAANGQSRANFISIGASISVPLFSTKRQDAEVAGAKLLTEAVRTEKRLIMRELMSGLSAAYEDYVGLSERFDIYRNTIVPQMTQQSQAALNAYTNDTGDFAEVVRAKIAELDAQITLLNINVSRRKALATINYFSPKLAKSHASDNAYSHANSKAIHDELSTSAKKDTTHD